MAERVSEAPGRDSAIALLSVTLDRMASAPLVRQLYVHLRELILTHRLAAGARLPSTRKLSRDLGVSRTVTLEAFGQLTAEGFLETRRGSGHFVARLELPRPIPPTHPKPLPPTDEAGTSIWSATGRPFDPAWQAVELFPREVWSRMLGRGWRQHHASALERHWGGLPVLREALAEHLRALRGATLAPEQVMITAGMTDALALIARDARAHGQEPVTAWVEDPGLGSSRDTLAREGVRTVPVPVDAEGLRVADGERLAPGAGLALITPTRQFPLGMPLSLPRRLALLDWARRSGAILLDDDYDGEIRFAGRPLQSFASLDPAARVLTLGSFSKLTFPGLRLGYLAGPSDLIARLIECRRDAYALVPTTAQAALAEFIATGAFARHLRALRAYLTRRRLMLIDALHRDVGDLLKVLPQEVGMHVTVHLAPNVALRNGDAALSTRAAEQGLVLLPLSGQYARSAGENGFLLGYAGWPEAEMTEAIRRMVALLRREVATSY